MTRPCPNCHGDNTRRSSTPVAEYTWRNRFYSRYRCRECQTQFWVISRKTKVAAGTLLGAIVIAVIAALVIGIVFNSEPEPGRRRAEALQLQKA